MKIILKTIGMLTEENALLCLSKCINDFKEKDMICTFNDISCGKRIVLWNAFNKNSMRIVAYYENEMIEENNVNGEREIHNVL